MSTHFDHDRLNRSVEQTLGWWELPILELRPELEVCEVANDACHGDGTAAPWRAKIKVE
jgi:hypothetical protein